MRDKTIILPGTVAMRLLGLAAKRYNQCDDETLDKLVQALIKEEFDRAYPPKDA
jgi:hypothetical protein